MVEDVVFLNEVGKQDIELAGGKGANLGELLQLSFPVPPGFIVTSFVYKRLIADLSKELSDSNDALGGQAIRDWITNLELSPALLKKIEHHDQDLQSKSDEELIYAVRSSATAEDLGDASFAGQHETYYYVKAAQLPLMIKKCWASLWSDAAYSYRESQGIKHDGVYMAVIVQKMIASEVSGITFTQDPLSGDENILVTDCSWGMGAAIVDGRVSPDHITVEKDTNKIITVKVADKKFMVPASSESDEPRLVEVPFAKKNKECLSHKEINLVTHWAKKCESHFGSPQDIEWAFSKKEFYLLQSRPITVAGKKEDQIPEGNYVLFKPLIENFTDPLLPLTQDLLLQIFPMMKIIQGRVYLNIKHIRLLLPFKMSDSEVADIAYLSDKNKFQANISWPRIIILLIILYTHNLTFGVLYQRTDNMPVSFMTSFRKKFQRIVEDDSIDAPAALEQLFLRAKFFEAVGNMPIMVNLAAPRYMFLLPILSKVLKRWIPELRDDASAYLTAGSEDIFSTDMGREIWHLSQSAKNTKFVKETILEYKSTEALQILKISPEAISFIQALTRFLNVHGHRTLKEFELSSKRWEEDPSPIISMIKNYLQADSNPLEAENAIRNDREIFANNIKSQLRHLPFEKLTNVRWRVICTLREKSKYFIRLRENSRFFHIMAFYAVRLKVKKVEARLMEVGRLKCKDDIYYLNWDEVKTLDRGELLWEEVEEIIRSRRMEHIRLTKIKPSKTFGIELAKEEAAPEDTILGQGASPGQYEGLARVINDPSTDAELHPGEILIAPYTDPAWTPLFLTASAAVVEVGSFLSHAGTIAREYGMPCVVDAPECTSRIKTGDRILVDGSSGMVSLLDNNKEKTLEGEN